MKSICPFVIFLLSALSVFSQGMEKPFFDAARDGDLAALKALLDKGAPVDSLDEKGWTPLMYACKSGKLDVVQFLLSKGAAINAKSCHGSSALSCAAESGNFKTVLLLIEKGAEVNSTAKDGITPLHLAVKFGSVEMIRLLLEKGAKINARTKFDKENEKSMKDRTPLFFAAFRGDPEIARLLISEGADVNIPAYHDNKEERKSPYYPVDIAEQEGHSEIHKIFTKDGALTLDDRKKLNDELDNAISAKQYDRVDGLIYRGANPNESGDRQSPLLRAEEFSDATMIRVLIENGADVELEKGELLVFAAEAGKNEKLKMLLEYKVDPNSIIITFPSQDRVTPLIAAAENNHPETVKILLENGAKVDQKDQRGRTALDFAENQHNQEVIDLLKKAGAAPVAPHHANLPNPLFGAINQDDLEKVKSLVEQGVDVNDCTTLDLNGDVMGADSNLGTPLFIAIRCAAVGPNVHPHCLEISKFLISKGADVNAAGDKESSYPPLPVAADCDDVELVSMMLEKGAKPNMAYPDGTTSLMVAARDGKFRIVQLLIKAGANVTTKNAKGETALSLARKGNRKDIADALVAAGAKE